MSNISEWQEALSAFIRQTEELTSVKITHMYVDDSYRLMKEGDNPFKLVLEGVKINHGKGN